MEKNESELLSINRTIINETQNNKMEKLDIKKNKSLDLEGSFTLMIVDGYACL
jgi:hypothetical protein